MHSQHTLGASSELRTLDWHWYAAHSWILASVLPWYTWTCFIFFCLLFLGTLYNHIGLHYAELKCFSEAEKCFTESLNLCSGKQFSIRKMAVLLQNLGAVDNALYHYEKSLRSHAEAADMYGKVVYLLRVLIRAVFQINRYFH